MRRVKTQFIVGIDEAGRGPLAGPVAVAAVMARSHLAIEWPGKDSKQLSAKQREDWFEKIKNSKIKCAVSLVGEKTIDEKGIVAAIKIGIYRILKRLKCDPNNTRILLDGSLRAPTRFLKQRTIIRGDETEPLIALASIVAKVTRDKKMQKFAKLHPAYNFDQHKGYGTSAHYRSIVKNGLSPLHRRTFCVGFE